LIDSIVAEERLLEKLSGCKEVKEVHVRWVVQKGNQFLSHRRSGGFGHSWQTFDSFEHARVWARETDAKIAAKVARSTHRGVKVVPVTVALGKPFAIFTE
jgi:hypothetical protein